MTTTRDAMAFDVVIVGAGPAGLSAAIHLKQLDAARRICVVEKGSAVGAHLMSGAVMDPRALAELFPTWQQMDAPLDAPVRAEEFLWRSAKKSWKIPTPRLMKSDGCVMVSLSKFGAWLGQQAENLGVEIYPGFVADEVLYDESGAVKGIATGEMGRAKNGDEKSDFQRGVELLAKQVIFAEGCRGHVSKKVVARYGLDNARVGQTYALGVKEVWEVPAENHREGYVSHSVGYPLKLNVYGGSFIYHMKENRVAIGIVVGLDYAQAGLSPFEELQQLKRHEDVAAVLRGGRRVAYGARTLVEGGLKSLPRLVFPGGVLVGDAAGFLNVPKIKGIHTAMKSGMLAAQAVHDALESGSRKASTYPDLFKASWLYAELKAGQDVRDAMRLPLPFGLALAGLYMVAGRFLPGLPRGREDRACTRKSTRGKVYPKPDGVLTFDKTSSLYLAGTNHEEDQPSHLKLKRPEAYLRESEAVYGAPETVYCPAGVYEIVEEGGVKRLQINAQNCLHCKACDIKDPTDNIEWHAPEGGGGPNYSQM